MTRYSCCDELRRNAVRGSALNGIDYLELDRTLPTLEQRQKVLHVFLVNDLGALALTADNVSIAGGERIRGIGVVAVTPGPAPNELVVEVDRAGDFSPYTLRLVQSPDVLTPPAGVDPRLAAVAFTFKAECPTDFDCAPAPACPPEQPDEPEIDYLAKDYASFRRLMLDRMAAVVPQWKERNPADLGVALVELLAHVGDRLSYSQDAVATEAYLGTARKRVSVRRHARLVDYRMHDGCNARTWVQIRLKGGAAPVVVPARTKLLTRLDGMPATVPDEPATVERSGVVFETMHEVELASEHDEMQLHTFSDERCCLPAGATAAALREHLDLSPGDVLVIEEVVGPRTGNAADADPSRRHAVRLTSVQQTTDPLDGQQVTEIAWDDADALPFPFCLSEVADDGTYLQNVSVARGNIVLADHGRSLMGEALGNAPQPSMRLVPAAGRGDRCDPDDPVAVFPRFRPELAQRPLTLAPPWAPTEPASAALAHRAADAVPQVRAEGVLGSDVDRWSPARDLLGSGPTDRHFVVEIESDHAAQIRFGDDAHGARPRPDTAFTVDYRVGNGSGGNIGAEALVHVAFPHPDIEAVRNPLPARGGVEPESIEDARQRAPAAFRTQERAVTPSDYAAMAERYPRVQRAAATFRWTGSWHTAFVTVDRVQGMEVDDAFEVEMRRHLERYRMAGYDLEVDGPRLVSLEIDLLVCVETEYFRSDVERDLLDVLGNRALPGGRRGFFHPDNLTFGQTIHLSRIYAAAQAVPGVQSVVIETFQRQGTPDATAVDTGVFRLGRLEIARLDNDRNFPEHGVLRIELGGGK